MNRILVAVGFIAAVSLSGCAHHAGTTTTVPEVEQRVSKALPVGSTREEIETWLKGEGVTFSFRDKSDLGSESSITDHVTDVSPYSGAVFAIIHDTDRSLLVTGSIQLRFLLASDGRLAKTIVSWIGTGP